MSGHAIAHGARKRLGMHLLGLGTAVEFFENVMFVFAAGHILGGVDAAPRDLVLVQGSYAVGSLLMIVQQQWLSRHFGYRRYLAAALALFLAGSIASAASDSVHALAAARFVQGVGGGALFTSCRILANVMFGPADRPAAVRTFMLWVLGASAAAPAVAATLIDAAGWRWVFLGAVPPAALALAGALWLLPDAQPRTDAPRWPLTALATFAVGAMSLQWVLASARFDAVSQPQRLALGALLAAAALGAFFWHQWRHHAPLLPFHALGNGTYLVGLLLYFVYYVLSNSANYLFPVYAEQGLGFTVEATGWLNSASAFVTVAAGIVYMRVARRFPDKRPLMGVGMAALVFAGWWFAQLPAGAGPALLWPGLLAKGIFGVLVILPVAALTFSQLGERFGQGYAAKNLLRQVAQSLATALAAVWLQDQQLAERGELVTHLSPDRADVTQWIQAVQATLAARGYGPEQAHRGALELLSRTVDQQAQLVACEHLYLALAAVALAAGAAIVLQRRFR